MEFECDEATSGAATMTIHGQAIDNAPSFSTSNGNISNRATTTASTAWNISDAWTVNSKYKTSNFSNVIQEIVNRSGWAANNDLAIIISGTGKRVAESYNGEAGNAAKLVVVYDNVVNTANLVKYSIQSNIDTELFSYDPDPNCASGDWLDSCLLYTSPSPRDATLSRMPSSA